MISYLPTCGASYCDGAGARHCWCFEGSECIGRAFSIEFKLSSDDHIFVVDDEGVKIEIFIFLFPIDLYDKVMLERFSGTTSCNTSCPDVHRVNSDVDISSVISDDVTINHKIVYMGQIAVDQQSPSFTNCHIISIHWQCAVGPLTRIAPHPYKTLFG